MKWLFVASLLLIGCHEPNVEEAFAYVSVIKDDGELFVGSGFLIENGYVATAHHVTKDTQAIFLKNRYGVETEAKVAYFNAKSDIALLKPEKIIWTEYIDLGEVKTGGIKEACVVGRSHLDGLGTTTLCGPAIMTTSHLYLIGKAVKAGTSGGPCIVGDYGVGVISTSATFKGLDKNEMHPGKTTCHTFSDFDKYTKVEQDTDTDSDSDTDTDSGTDTDTNTETDSDTETDSYSDTDTDTLQHFGDLCEGNNPWECDPITNDGCDENSDCDWGIETETMTQGFMCFEFSTGNLGDECNLQDGPYCNRGLTCAQTSVGSPLGECTRYCCKDNQCEEGFECMSTLLNLWSIYTGKEFGICLPTGTPFFPF